MILKGSVSTGQRLSREVTMIDIGDIDIHILILIGIGAVRGAEADEGDNVGELESWDPNMNRNENMKSTTRFNLYLCTCADPQFFMLVALSIQKCVCHSMWLKIT